MNSRYKQNIQTYKTSIFFNIPDNFVKLLIYHDNVIKVQLTFYNKSSVHKTAYRIDPRAECRSIFELTKDIP